MSTPLDPRRLQLKGLPGPPRKRLKVSHKKRMGKFIKGPIPRAWILSAAQLRDKALHVGMEVWFRAGLAKSKSVFISLSGIARDMGFSRSTASRGLGALERAGLVTVERSLGRKPRVTVVEVDDGAA